MKTFFLILIISGSAQAWDSAKCSKLLNDGWFKKYQWAGVGDYNVNAMTKESKKSGSFTGSSNVTTEGTTAASDPGYTTNVSVSQANITSSFGDCSLFALKERSTMRELYVQQNYEQFKKDVARGQGDHLEALAWLNLCEDGAQVDFNKTVQHNYQELFASGQGAPFVRTLDEILEKNLGGRCYNLSKL
jgi:Protein of unknown function (DUF3015)